MIENPGAETEQAQLDAAKQRIRQILSELKSLSKSESEPEAFLGHLLGRTIEATGSNGAAIWQMDGNGQVSVVYEAGKSANTMNLDGAAMENHYRLIRTVIDSSRPTLIDPDARDTNTGEVINPMPFLLMVKPLVESSYDRKFAIELYQRPDIPPAARTGYMRFLEEIGETFTGWQSRNQLRLQTKQQRKSQRTLNFIKDIHSSLEPRKVAYAATNDGRILAECDRLSVLSFDGRRAKVLSVSGQDDFDNRSNVIRRQEDLATAVCRNPQTVWLVGSHSDLPRSLQQLVDDYLTDSHARTLGVIPLFDGEMIEDEDADPDNDEVRIPSGAMIVEWFGQEVQEHERSTEIAVLADHVGRALSNAQEHFNVFLMPVWKAIGSLSWLVKAKTLPKTLLGAIAALVLILIFCFFPYPFDMRVQGFLQPVDQQNVFANIDGVIKKVHVDHGQAVTEGQLLVELRNDELEYQYTVADGQLNQVEQEIQTVTAMALATPDSAQPDQYAAAAERLNGLYEKKATLVRQKGLLQQRLNKLQIFSPIDGKVVSWDPVRQLTERPVRREDVVLVVAATDSDWELELFIPERKYGHVLSAGEKPKVTFFAQTDPGKAYQGQVQEIEGHSSEHPSQGSSVRAIASFDQTESPDLYVGAAVTAKIHCGTSSIGYAWFHELIEFVQSRLLF